MVFELHIQLGGAMKTYDDIARSLEQTANKLRDYEQLMVGETGRIMGPDGKPAGVWLMTSSDPGNGDNVL
jgi:hypothetical protein